MEGGLDDTDTVVEKSEKFPVIENELWGCFKSLEKLNLLEFPVRISFYFTGSQIVQ